MAKKATTRRKPAGCDLTRLTQAEAAWLIGKPAVWLRDNAHLDGRNTDGSYDAKKLVRSLRTEYEVAELSNQDLEFSLHLADGFAEENSSHGEVVPNILKGIEQKHGVPGLAAFARVLLETTEAWVDEYGSQPITQPTADEIREEARQEAERKIEELKNWDARRQLRTLYQCPSCRRYRFGKEWLADLPKGYAHGWGSECPDCVCVATSKITPGELLQQIDEGKLG